MEEILGRTSRTFALAIPLLPEGLRTEVGLSYLLFRIADTLEDGERWRPEQRARALREFADVLGGSVPPDWLADPPTDQRDYLELLGRSAEVMAAVSSLPTRAIILEHVKRTTQGMETWAASGHAVRDLEGLKQYCYVVAGIVGELLTELFCQNETLGPRRERLLRNAAVFGEGLQLVNVLKDRTEDAAVGRVFVSAEMAPRVFELAREDLTKAASYVSDLEGGPRGIIAFCTLPLQLANATLTALEAGRPKLSRSEVAAIFEKVPA